MLKYLLRDKSANSIRGNTYPQVPPCHRGPTSPFPKDSLRFAPQAFSLPVEIFLYLLHCISLIGYRTSNVHWQTYHGDCNYFFTQVLPSFIWHLFWFFLQLPYAIFCKSKTLNSHLPIPKIFGSNFMILSEPLGYDDPITFELKALWHLLEIYA